MVERLSRVMSLLFAKRSLAVAVTGGLLSIGSIGCGRYEPEPEYPQQPQYALPTPPSAEELAAQQAARQQAAAESREILIGADDEEYADTDPSALTEFKPALEDHGTWVTDSTYGTVWVPAKEEVGTDFQPYVTAGHWTYSESTDYVWVSDYSWGWAPFHYGRWVYLPGHGWAWIPGRRYAGAWVTWRVGPAGYGYVGWAPAPPAWYWYDGVAYGWSFGWYDYHDHYVYCPHTHVYHHTVGTYVVRGPAARGHYGRTQDYVPARPSVGGGSTSGSGDRVVANPSVSGGGRVIANPGVGGSNRVAASPGVKGPRPDELGLKTDAVVAPPSSHQGLSRAQALAIPSTAVAAGAAAPAHLRARTDVGGGQSATDNRGPATPASVPAGSAAMAGRQQTVAGFANPSAVPPSGYRSQPAFAPSPTPPSGVASGGSPRPTASSPSFGASQSATSASVRASSPSYASPSSRSSSPSFTGSSPSPSVRSSSPSFTGSSPSPSVRSSSPAVRSTPGSSPSFQASSPAVRSSPSVSAPSRSASPSRSSSQPVRSGGGARKR